MKRILLPLFIGLLGSTSTFAQTEVTAVELSKNDLTGTARSVAMGGAFGALGGDISGVAINPAGIGIYQQSEVVGSLNFQNSQTKTTLNAGSIDKSKFKVDFDNFGLVGVFPIGDDAIRSVNFGFTYNRLKNFDRRYQMQGQNVPSMTHFMADQANISEMGGYPVSNDNWDGNWLGIFGYDGGLIQKNGSGIYQSKMNNANNNLYVREKGSINSFDFNAGTTISNIVSIGATVSVTDIDYKLYSSYNESFNNDYFNLINNKKIEGTGYQLKVGTIIKPIEELRIGIAYHSPTWYEMSSHKFGDFYSSYTNKWVYTPTEIDEYYYVNNTPIYSGTENLSREDFDFRTPDKWTFSLAGIIAQRAIISVDYEITNYKSNMRFDNVDWDSYFGAQNEYIEQDFRNASMLRVGSEVRITPQFSGRIGFAWSQSPFVSSFKDDQTIDISYQETAPQYTVQGDTYNFTWGAGYRFTQSLYADIAFIVKNRTDALYAFPKVYDNGQEFVKSDKAEIKNNIFSGVLTLGYRF